MTQLQECLTDFKKKIDGWTPDAGFKPARLNFTPADLIYGKHIANSVRKHGCSEGSDLVIDEIRAQAKRNHDFEKWFLGMQPDRLQTLCEFLIYRTPPH